MDERIIAWNEVHDLCQRQGMYNVVKDKCTGKERVLRYIKQLHLTAQPQEERNGQPTPTNSDYTAALSELIDLAVELGEEAPAVGAKLNSIYERLNAERQHSA